MVADPNVMRHIHFLTNLLSINTEIFLLWIRFNPLNPFAPSMLEKKINKLIEKMRKELDVLDKKL